MRTRANVGHEREYKSPAGREKNGGSLVENFAPGFAARENSLAVEACKKFRARTHSRQLRRLIALR